MSTILHSGRGMVHVSVDKVLGVDGQGKPQYATPVDILARVVHQVTLIQRPDGSTINADATMWIDGQQPLLPDRQDQITLADGTLYEVLERKDGVTLNGGLDHIRVMCRIMV